MPTPARYLTHNGETLKIDDWAKKLKIPANTIRARIDKLGWPTDRALGEPIDRRFGSRKKRSAFAPRPCPEMREHSTGQAYCRWKRGGKEHWRYFGLWGSAAALKLYKRFQAEWVHGGADKVTSGAAIFVAELCDRFLDYAVGYYVKNGKPTSEIYGYRAAISVLNELYGDYDVKEFGPDHLRAVVSTLAERGLARLTVNVYTFRIVRVFDWGSSRNLSNPEAVLALKAVEPLRAGRSNAPDAAAKKSIDIRDVNATLPGLHHDPKVRPIFEAMIRLQLVTGMRPGEVCGLKVQDIDQSDPDVWVYEVAAGKNLHRGQVRRVWIGPRGQAILAPFLTRPTGHVFQFVRLKAKAAVNITVNLYNHRVAIACEKMGVAHWHPHQLRHNRASEVKRVYESDAAVGAAIGDTPEVARQVYQDDPSEAVAKRVAKETG